MLSVSPSLIASISAIKALLEMMDRSEAPIQVPALSLPTVARLAKPLVRQKVASTFTLMVPGRGGAQTGLG